MFKPLYLSLGGDLCIATKWPFQILVICLLEDKVFAISHWAIKPAVIIDRVRELVMSNMQNKFEQDTRKTFEGIAPTR